MIDSLDLSENQMNKDGTTLYISIEDVGIEIDNGELVIPQTVNWNENKYEVTGIFNKTFSKNEEIISVVLPDSITWVGEYAFYQCENLNKIKFSDNLVNIGSYAFAGCDSLEKLSFPDSLYTISDYGFAGCEVLKEVDLSNCSIKTIKEGAFRGCPVLYKVVLPDDLEEIENWVFNSDVELKQIEIPENVFSIGSNIFAGTEECVLYVIADLYVEQFAQKNDMQYEIMEKKLL